MEKIIEVISEDRRYRTTMYPAVIMPDDSRNSWINGLEAGPGKEDFLTRDEIMKVNTVKPTKRAEQFPSECIIGPDEIVGITHGQKLNITPLPKHEGSKYPGDYIHPRHFALHCFYLTLSIIAPSKATYNQTSHRFYMLDKEFEATARQKERSAKYEAYKFLNEGMSLTQMVRIANLIRLETNAYQFGDISKLSPTGVADKLHEIADKDPSFILMCDASKYPDVATKLFIVDALIAGILKRKGVEYYDQEKYVGTSMNDIIRHLNGDDNVPVRWKTSMQSKSK